MKNTGLITAGRYFLLGGAIVVAALALSVPASAPARSPDLHRDVSPLTLAGMLGGDISRDAFHRYIAPGSYDGNMDSIAAQMNAIEPSANAAAGVF